MQPKYLMSAGVLLVAVVIGVIGLRDGKDRLAVAATDESGPAVNPPSKSARGPRLDTKRTLADLSSAEAGARLRNLLEQRPSSSHRFETVERWVRHLDDADLQELVGELGMEEYAGLTGWVRCALYAEWARRDPKVALARAEQLPDSGDNHNYAVQQVLFSVLRGWGESNPKAAFAEKKRLAKRIGPGNSPANHLIYQELVRRDPEATWQKCKSSPPKAFFKGLDGKESVAHYLDRWDKERWSSTETQQKFASYKTEMESNQGTLVLLDFVQEPIEERVAAGAALTLAEYDVEGAVTWLSQHGPGDDTDRRGRISTMLGEWATAHPAEALKLIEEDRLQSYTGWLATAAIMGDPGIATAVMQSMDNHGERARALQDVHRLDSNSEHDFFPAPGLPNRLPNFQERYECLLEAVEAVNFRPGEKVSLLRNLNANFRSEVPEAQRAYEAMKELN
jgi:hypothetical protein